MAQISAITGRRPPDPFAAHGAAGENRRAEPKSAARTPETEALDAEQGRAVVAKASADAATAFARLDALREDLAKAADARGALSADDLAALDSRLAQLRGELDRLAGEGAVKNANLLSRTAATVVTPSGDRISIAARPLDGESLGLAGLTIADTASLRAAAGRVALATAEVQTKSYALAAAAGVLTPERPDPGVEAFEKARAARAAAPAAGTAAAALDEALARRKAMASGRAGVGRHDAGAGTILDLFT